MTPEEFFRMLDKSAIVRKSTKKRNLQNWKKVMLKHCVQS